MDSKFEDKGLLIPNTRRAAYAIDPIFLRRWSPRAFDPSPIPEDTLKAIFEAARWSMSCYNDQPWLIAYAVTPEDRKLFCGLLAEGNQRWAADAPVLGFIFARRRFRHNDKPNRWAEFDCGAAWMAMTMQARMMGLYTHGMAGFDEKGVYPALGISEDHYHALCAFALGQYGDYDNLPRDIKEREMPNQRQPLDKIINQGKFDR